MVGKCAVEAADADAGAVAVADADAVVVVVFVLMLLLLLLWLWLLLLLLITRWSLEIAVKAGVLGCGMLAYRFVGLSSVDQMSLEFTAWLSGLLF